MEEKVRMSINCSAKERQQIKILATLHKQSINDWVMDSVRDKIKQEVLHVPNKETANALRESGQGEGVENYETIEELFASLGI